MKRFELTRVRITKDESGDYNVGEVYCAIKDNSEFSPEWLANGSFQPYGLIIKPIDAKSLHDVMEEANISNDPINLCDCEYFDWVIADITDCEEV